MVENTGVKENMQKKKLKKVNTCYVTPLNLAHIPPLKMYVSLAEKLQAEPQMHLL